MNHPATPLRILVVDDEPAIRRLLKVGLTPDGYSVTDVDNGTSALEAVRRDQVDLIVLDLGLPDIDGLQVIKRIRYAQSRVMIIVLSSRGEEAAKVSALDLGADDYVVKPFGIDELLARIRVLDRNRIKPPAEPAALSAGEITVNLQRRNATVRGGEVGLSPREYELLHLLVQHAGKVLTHNFILRQVWGSDTDVQYLRIYIRALRQKIEREPDRPSLIVTVPGVGYRLRIAEPPVMDIPMPHREVAIAARV
jgi:two-component system KDP operon response regulator KdpE